MNVKKLSLCAGFFLAVLNVAYPDSNAITVDDCWSSWNGSSAAVTCSGGSSGADCGTTTVELMTSTDPYTYEKSYTCKVATKCLRGGVSASLSNYYCNTSSEDGFWSVESFEGTLSDVGNLSNCQGSLTNGSCQ
ncbi:MAG: hypothetical protein OXB88_10495 [Bacteriovoracales bacterium]|nr:hypothetical protein [Bacteriovoracales bacterium]